MATIDSIAVPKYGTTAVPLRRDGIVLEELDGEAILYDPRYGAIHRFNDVTLFVWDLCDGVHAVQDMAHRLTQLSEVAPGKAMESVQRVIAELQTLDLLEGNAAEPMNPATVPCWTESPAEQRNRPAHPEVGEARPLRLSRRQLLGCGVTKIVFVAPVISTFFASGAYASGPSASAAFGTGGCKTVGYSCSVNGDCCEGGTKTACQTGTCCVQHNETGCTSDADCCNGPDVCNSGTCE